VFIEGTALAGLPPPPSNETLALALAIVGSSATPLVLLDGGMRVIAASRSFCDAFGLDPGHVAGRFFHELGTGEWNVPQLESLLGATASGFAEVQAYEMDIRTGARHGTRTLVVNAHRLEYGEPDQVRILLGVADVTDARAAAKLKDDLLREKAILLQEVQHRVANSLQIIASVILQSARKVQSEETRTHLTDAHNRVMSVASLQQQLAASRLGDVDLAPYFIQICRSVGASMIHDPKQLSLDVDCDDAAVPAEVSVSLGLIITELVINSLKHAYPGGRKGRITVSYRVKGPNWTLAVADDGVGMPRDAASARPGLGTNIVEALAKQLKARVQVTAGHPGTTVSIIHIHLAAVGLEVEFEPDAAGTAV